MSDQQQGPIGQIKSLNKEYRKEWNIRTWWGKLQLAAIVIIEVILAVLMLPVYIVVWTGYYLYTCIPPKYKEDRETAQEEPSQ